MPGNLVVARFVDGRMVKGLTLDFLPNRDVFHIQVEGAEMVPIRLRDLKAVFFVRDLEGDASHQDVNEFDVNATMSGRKIRVVYEDGEELVGTTQGYSPDRPGFFVQPADRGSNNLRIYVVAAATSDVHFI